MPALCLIEAKMVAKAERNRQHPLSHRRFGNYMVNEMRRRIGHAPASTSIGAEPSISQYQQICHICAGGCPACNCKLGEKTREKRKDKEGNGIGGKREKL
jgi:hypothetical protein